MSLRRRLVVGMLVLLVAGLVTTDVLTSSSLRSFLLGRLDEQIDVSQDQAYTYISQVYQRDLKAGDRTPLTDPRAWLAGLGSKPTSGVRFGRSPTDPRLNGAAFSARVGSDAYVEVISSSGKVVIRVPSGGAGNPDPAPALPRVLRVQPTPKPAVFGTKHGPYSPQSPSTDVSAVGSSHTDYRVQAVAVPGGTLVTAISLDPTEKTLASLTHIELFVSIGVMVALLLLVLWVVRLGMRPLDDMTETAGAIAGGDLTRRIRRADDRSEVGRLGVALNGMLSQIEAAFRERTSSEARLRRFVADASHELRTPLTSIRGYAELLRKGAFDTEGERRRAAERIEGEASRMGLLVDDLLLLARLDQGRPLERDAVDLCKVVGDAVHAVRTTDSGRVVTLEMRRSGDGARRCRSPATDRGQHPAQRHGAHPPGHTRARAGRAGRAERRGAGGRRGSRGSTPSRRPGSSIASIVAARLVPAKVPAWDCRSWLPRPGPMAGAPVSTPPRVPAPCSAWRSLPGTPRPQGHARHRRRRRRLPTSAPPGTSTGGGDEHLAPSVRS